MSSSVPVTSSPEELVFTFKQGDEESFKDAWSRIFTSYRKAEPQMTLSLLLSNFYFTTLFAALKQNTKKLVASFTLFTVLFSISKTQKN